MEIENNKTEWWLVVILRADRRLCAATVGMVTPLQWIRDQELRGADNPAVDHTCMMLRQSYGICKDAE